MLSGKGRRVVGKLAIELTPEADREAAVFCHGAAWSCVVTGNDSSPPSPQPQPDIHLLRPVDRQVQHTDQRLAGGSEVAVLFIQS